MRIIFIVLFATASSMAADVRNVNGSVVDLAPIYQWRETNGPATNRPLPAWKGVRVMEVGEQVSVYTKAIVMIGGFTNVVLLDHLPDNIRNFLTQETQLGARVQQLEVFVSGETQRLRLLAAQSVNMDGGSTDYNQFLLDRANLENRKEEMAQLSKQLADMKSREPAEMTDFALQMNKKYTGLDIWDFGLKTRQHIAF